MKSNTLNTHAELTNHFIMTRLDYLKKKNNNKSIYKITVIIVVVVGFSVYFHGKDFKVFINITF